MHLRTRALVAVIGALTALLVTAAAAPAATYTQYVCQKPDGTAAGRDGFNWSRYGTSTGVEDNCGTGGALAAYLPNWGAGATYNEGSMAEWSYYVPPSTGLTVSNVSMGRGADGIQNGIRFSIRNGAGNELDACTTRGGQNGVVCPSFGSGMSFSNLGSGFSMGVYCPASGTCTQPYNDARPEGRIDHLAITLRDNANPEITNSPAGTGLFNTSSPRAGSQPVSYTAQDGGGGLYKAILRVDGQDHLTRTIDGNSGKCQAPFVYQVPCKTSAVNDSFNVDTTQLSDGTHLVQLIVRDATDVNQATYGPVEITVDNIAAPSPPAGSRPTIDGSPQVGAELTARPGTWSGENVAFAYQWQRCDADGGNCADIGSASEQRYTVTSRDVGSRLRVVVTGSNAEGSGSESSRATPVIAQPTDPNPAPRGIDPEPVPGASTPSDRGAANGSGASDRVRLSGYFGRQRRTTVRTRYGRSARISGRLLDSANRPISGAVLQVMAEPRVRAAQMDDLGTVRTDSDGRYSYTVSAGPSRLVRIGYRSHANDQEFTDTTDVLVLVQAGVSLKPRPRKLRNGNVGTFTGRASQPIPLRGVLVDLQVRVGRQWRTFAVVRTGRNGKYRYRHRFRNTFVATTFRFRARVRRETDYPYIIGYSRIAKLKVRP